MGASITGAIFITACFIGGRYIIVMPTSIENIAVASRGYDINVLTASLYNAMNVVAASTDLQGAIQMSMINDK